MTPVGNRDVAVRFGPSDADVSYVSSTKLHRNDDVWEIYTRQSRFEPLTRTSSLSVSGGQSQVVSPFMADSMGGPRLLAAYDVPPCHQFIFDCRSSPSVDRAHMTSPGPHASDWAPLQNPADAPEAASSMKPAFVERPPSTRSVRLVRPPSAGVLNRKIAPYLFASVSDSSRGRACDNQ